MLEKSVESQLLFGLIAIQLRFVSIADLSRSMVKWNGAPESSLEGILIDEGLLDSAAATLVARAAEHHVAMAGGDPARGLLGFAGSEELEALRGLLDQTLNFTRPVEQTIERHESGPFPGVIPAMNGPLAGEPTTEANGEAFDGLERTITFDGAARARAFRSCGRWPAAG